MDFQYVAIDKEGRRIKSFMKAESESAVASAIRTSGGRPLKIRVLKKPLGQRLGGAIFADRRRITAKELVVFTRQLGAILGAGVLLSEALETIAADLENKYFADVLQTVLFQIRGGESFSNALALHPAVFSPYYIAVVRSGEEIGNLGKTISGLAGYMEQYETMRLKLLGAIRYPIFLICFVICIVSGIVLFLIPRFKVIFEGAGVQLPLLTRIVVGVSEFALGNSPFIIAGLVILAIVVWRALQIFSIRFAVDYMLLRTPLLGKVIHKALIARFCQTSSMLLEGGVGLITALNLSGGVTGNLFLKQTFAEIRRSVTGGASFSEAMRLHADIPRILVKMVAVGEKSGTLPDMVRRMGNYYDEEVETFLNNVNSLLEPIFIIFIGSVVVVVALALYLPIFSLSGVVR